MRALKSTFFIFFLFICFFGNSQTQGIAFEAVGKGAATTFVSDYHCLGINNSALGWGTGFKDKHFTMGLTEFGAGVYSDALNVGQLKNLYGSIKDAITNNSNAQFNWQQAQQTAGEYAAAGVNMFAHYNWFGFSYQNQKFGGIAFNITENYNWNSRLNARTTDLIFNGRLADYFDSLTIVINGDTSMIANVGNLSQDTLNAVIQGNISVPLNISEITKGSEVKAVWNRHFNFGYGRKIFGKDSVFVVYGGIGGRFIQSVAMFNMTSNEDGLYMYSSMSPNFNLDYGSIANGNPSTSTETGRLLPKVVGNGFGIDLSASIIMFNKLKIAAAVNNIGNVTYTRNVYKVNDTLVSSVTLNGLSDYNVTQAVNQMLNTGGILSLQGQEKYTIENASNFRLGASFDIGKVASLGFDLVTPFDKSNPGSIANAVFAFGGEVKPIKWLSISAGYFGGGIYQNNIPLGIRFILKDGAYEFGISSYDALSFFMEKSNSISTSFGFARFRF
jgi:hypothetical protein